MLQEFNALCEQEQVKAINIDARNIDPSPDSFTIALRQSLDDSAENSPLEALATSGERCVIHVDTSEKLAPLDGGLRETFLPQLPENVLMVMAGREPLMAWLDLMGARELFQREDYSSASRASATVVLSESDFATAVQAVLRTFIRPEALRNNPLLNSRLVIEQCGVNANAGRRIETLLSLTQNAAESLQSSPRETKFYRVLHRTYFNPAESQELAAEALHLSFSTYRRYLKSAIMRVTEMLWDKEISA